MIQALDKNDHTPITAFGEPPRFHSAEHWIRHFDEATQRGERSWPPATRDELLLAEESGLLELHPEWIPSRIGLRLLGLPDHFGRTLEPYSERFKERFLRTLVSDNDFAAAVFNVIRGEG